jgi:hypothetical protein
MTKARSSRQWRSGRRAAAGLLVAGAALAPAAVHAAAAVEDPAQRVLVLTVRAVDGAAHMLGASGGRAGMLHRFVAELVDSTGAVIGAQWEASVYVVAANGVKQGTLVRLHAAAPEFALPRPFGYRLGEEDSLVVAVSVHTHAVEGDVVFHFRLRAELEPLDGHMSRLDVLPHEAVRVDALHGTAPVGGRDNGSQQVHERRWEWQAAVSGRMLALAGAPLHGARELVLEDAATGEVIWRGVLPAPQQGAAFVRAAQIVRLGVAGEAGRVYRLTAHYAPDAAGAVPAGELRMLLHPSAVAGQ